MKPFMDQDFLLKTETARRLYHRYAADLPIIDYHCHLNAREIYENRPAANLTQLWLGGDHYKWRAMRANGIPEARITGDADAYDKFLAFAETLPYAAGNPLYHWAHLELQRYFGITEALNPRTAPGIWQEVNSQLADGLHTPQFFIRQSNVEALCTTEDPADTLEYHALLAAGGTLPTKIVPAFRPDLALSIAKPGWRGYLDRLAGAASVEIADWDGLLRALTVRMDAFAAAGCVASDHGFEEFPYAPCGPQQAAAIFAKALRGETLTRAEADGYRTELMLWLGRAYAARRWAMELHINALRDANTAGVASIGEASGFDSVNDDSPARRLNGFLNALETTKELPKTILFSLNDADNLVIATTAGNFQSSELPGKMQMGSAWWFQDHADGMERQMRTLANEGLLGRFLGMLTDSRSFLSYPRHEYFRRILCDLLGRWVEEGEYPDDEETLAMLVRGICYQNAKEYFGL